MRRIVLTSLTFVIVASATVASAASLGASSSNFGAGSAAVSRCHTGPITAEPVVNDGKVTHVSIDDLADACDGSRLQLVLLDSAGAKLGEGGLTPVPSDRPFDVTIAEPTPDATVVASTSIAITGS